jgi:hypothetical protein
MGARPQSRTKNRPNASENLTKSLMGVLAPRFGEIATTFRLQRNSSRGCFCWEMGWRLLAEIRVEERMYGGIQPLRLLSRLVAHRHRPRGELPTAHQLQVDIL